MMSREEKLRLLNKLLEKSESVTVEDSDHPAFKSWKNLVERTFVKVFGKSSTEYEHFSELLFYYRIIAFSPGDDFTSEHLQAFRRDFSLLIDSIKQYIEDLEEEEPKTMLAPARPSGEPSASKVFISHASSDAEIVEELIELLESVGLESTQIFCTSFEGYGIGLGENFLDAIKNELQGDVLVLFVLSKNFYGSPVCLCEMGASWVLSRNHVPILVPPLDYSDVKGVIPLSQGLKINEALKLNLLKEKIENLFSLQNKMSMSTWERKRDRAMGRIEKLIAAK